MGEQRVLLYEKNLEILWGDMDALGHVNNARYFSYLENLRIAWMRELKATKEYSANGNTAAVIARIEADYLKPVIFPATLTMRLYADAPGRTSIKTYNEIWDAEDATVCYMRAICVLVWYDFNLGKAHPLPESIRQQVEHAKEN